MTSNLPNVPGRVIESAVGFYLPVVRAQRKLRKRILHRSLKLCEKLDTSFAPAPRQHILLQEVKPKRP